MYKIGDFAKISQISIYMLRHYDKIGLLHPRYIDEGTGYRYYSVEQLPRLNRILVLKELGFSLEQIGSLLEENLSVSEIQGMLKLRESQIEQEIEADQARLERVRTRLRQIEHEGRPPLHDVLVKPVPKHRVLSSGLVTEPDPVLVELAIAMAEEISAQGLMARDELHVLIHGPPTSELCHNVELGFVVTADAPSKLALRNGSSLTRKEIPAHEMVASTTYNGPRLQVEQGYAALCRWIEEQDYRVCGHFREVYLRPTHESNDPENLVELQIPICE